MQTTWATWRHQQHTEAQKKSPIEVRKSMCTSETSILTLIIMFRAKTNVAIYIEPRNGVKISQKWVLGMSILTQKMTCPHLRRKQNILKNPLCNLVSMKQSVN
jgi:hypothetical protein